jgi:hypothetical protein
MSEPTHSSTPIIPPQLREWLEEGLRSGHLYALGIMVDEAIGRGGYDVRDGAHLAHINLGAQETIRRVRMFLNNPLSAKVVQQPPAPTYGVKVNEE